MTTAHARALRQPPWKQRLPRLILAATAFGAALALPAARSDAADPSITPITVAAQQNSTNAARLLDAATGTTAQQAWTNSNANIWAAASYPMSATLELPGRYNVSEMQYYVGEIDQATDNVEFSFSTTSATAGFSSPLSFTTGHAWGSWTTRPLTGTQAQWVRITFATPAARFHISELKLLGTPVTVPPASAVESFGDNPPPARTAHAWMAVDTHYQTVPSTGYCSKAVHDKYWRKGPDGDVYPTWHPVTDIKTGCKFDHEHGMDPRNSPLYAAAGGVPFGYASQVQITAATPQPHRHEDHAGHKVTVQSNWKAVSGNPQNTNEFIVPTNITCNWLSKIHQGTHSPDALGNNVHEYFINISCTDGTLMRVKQMIPFGNPGQAFNECSAAGAAALGQQVGWVNGGVAASPVVWPQQTNDGKREFACVQDRLYASDARLGELWKPDGVISTPKGGGAFFSPYYMVMNPARSFDPAWSAHGRPNGWFATIDLCFNDTAAWNQFVVPMWSRPGMQGYTNKEPLFCAAISASAKTALKALPVDQRWSSPLSPFNGTQRAVHPKSVMIYNAGGTKNVADGMLFCTDAMGRNPVDPQPNLTCKAGTIPQVLGVVANNWDTQKINGSDVNSVTVGAQVKSPGFGYEWVHPAVPGILPRN